MSDLRNITLGQLADALGGSAAGVSNWIDIRSGECPVPYRAALAAAQRGELHVHRVGRRGLVRRDDLDGWIARQPKIGTEPEVAPLEESPAAKILRREGWSKRA